MESSQISASHPSEQDLSELRGMAEELNWDLDSVIRLVNRLREVWWHAEIGVTFRFRLLDDVWELCLQTLGWDGNERVIETLRGTLFWVRFWQVHKRGGLYLFSNIYSEQEREQWNQAR